MKYEMCEANANQLILESNPIKTVILSIHKACCLAKSKLDSDIMIKTILQIDQIMNLKKVILKLYVKLGAYLKAISLLASKKDVKSLT
ncbi:gem-associated protein 5 [Vespula squamosa]|uniref:Gem-associated protein 5 n=1 Tax=Vespula squamosa TaxID=30214 RepID=A0ABD2C1Z4_VESSQ